MPWPSVFLAAVSSDENPDRDPLVGQTRSGIRRNSLPPLLWVIASVVFVVLAALSYRLKLAKSVLDYFINN
jgi:hypothetical protein